MAFPLQEENNSKQQPLSKNGLFPEKLEALTSVEDGSARNEIHSETETQDANSQLRVHLSWWDRLLALWTLLAIVVGILLGNYVDGLGDVLQRGKFVNVSAPIGK